MSDFLQLSFDHFARFHFLRPAWLLLLLPLLALWYARRFLNQETQWQQIIPPHLAKVLLAEPGLKQGLSYRTLLLFWLVATLAMAGPTWQKIEKPVFKVKQASVILMDLSMSMRATDIKPNRLTKARFKALDLAQAIPDGDLALVAYAGDAFTISPLTPDARNITALIPSLTPEIMPEQGSYPLAGLEKSAELLNQAGYPSGTIYWLTDGIDLQDWSELQSFVSATPYRIHILAIGTPEGAPIKMEDTSLLKDHRGSIVIPKLTLEPLNRLASLSRGSLVNLTANDADIKRLVAAGAQRTTEQANSEEEDENLTGDDWHEFGPYLLLLLLPALALKFRRGAVLSLLLPVLVLSPMSEVQAAATNQKIESQKLKSQAQAEPTPIPWYARAFKTRDQKGLEQYESGNYLGAQYNFEHEQWKGSAAYKVGDFDTALAHFSKDTSAQGWYNRGNALARLNQLDKAIQAYEEALTLAPDMQIAKDNKALLEQLKQQQEDQSQEQNDNQSGDQSQQQDQQNGGQESEQGQEQDGDNQQGQNQQEQAGQEQQNQEQQSQSNQSQASQPEPTSSPEDQARQSQQESAAEQAEAQQDQNGKEGAKQAQLTQPEQDKDGQEGEAQQVVPLTPEQIAEQEQQQKIQQLLRKVTDDPAVLLRNKMILESRKRQQNNRLPKGAIKQW